MTRFGVLSYKGSGHLNPLMALSRQLTARGHRVTFFLHPEFEQRVRQYGLEFYPIDILSSSKTVLAKPKPTTRIGQTQAAMHRIAEQMEAFLHAYPPAIATVFRAAACSGSGAAAMNNRRRCRRYAGRTASSQIRDVRAGTARSNRPR